MKTFGNISLALFIGILPVVSGCTTISSKSSKTTVNINRGDFDSQGDGKIGNDIKSLLAQGGLDANNPGASTSVAKADDTPKTLSTTATDLKTLVSQLDTGSAPTPASTRTKTTQPVVTAPKSTALALAEQPKPTPAAAEIATTTENTTFAPIGTPGELVPIMPAPTIVTQPLATKPSPVLRATPKTRRVVTEAENSNSSSYRAPTVKRF
jgi:hypothetical protein